jgi:hypothetical protein
VRRQPKEFVAKCSRKRCNTSASVLAARLGISDTPQATGGEPTVKPEPEPDLQAPGGDVYGDAKDLYGDDMPDIAPGTHDLDGGDAEGRDGSGSGAGGAGLERVSVVR